MRIHERAPISYATPDASLSFLLQVLQVLREKGVHKIHRSTARYAENPPYKPPSKILRNVPPAQGERSGDDGLDQFSAPHDCRRLILAKVYSEQALWDVKAVPSAKTHGE